jgi:large subunit ribosomal protein L18Ae
MAARHRARFHAIQIIKVMEVKNADVRRPYIQQVIEKNIAFPLPHRVLRPADKSVAALFVGVRPNTH